jgi:hypothetical protein
VELLHYHFHEMEYVLLQEPFLVLGGGEGEELLVVQTNFV